MLYIIIEEHSGVLLNIYRCLSSANYKVSSNEFCGTQSNQMSYVKLIIEEGTLPLPPDLEGKILNINGCLDILYEEPTTDKKQTNDSKKQLDDPEYFKKEIKLAAKKIIQDFDKVATLVSNFSHQHRNCSITNHTYFLGYEVGSSIYESEFSLGKPLKLELVLKRMLSDAIKKFGSISCNKHVISIENNIFCETANPDSHCDFTKGFMAGFLHSSPTTKSVKIENIACRSHGQSSCTFEFH